MKRLSLLFLILAMSISAAWPYRSYTRRSYPRSREVTREFQRENPCPSTGKRYGPCPGYVKDHVRALCAGGPDAVSNLAWQTTADAKAKDRWECRK